MKPRYLGKVKVTDELLARLLGVPYDCKPVMMSVDNDHRVFSLTFESNKPIYGLTVPVSEGCEPPCYTIPSIIPDEGPIPLAYLRIYHAVRQRLIGEEPVEPVVSDIDDNDEESRI